MKKLKKITNEISTTGLAICPVCNHSASWMEGGMVHTSPLVRIQLSNLDALVHRCCLHRLYTDINGQISIHYRKKFLLNLIPACGKFLSGAASLTRLLFKYGVKAGLEQFKTSRSSLPLRPKTAPGAAFGHGNTAVVRQGRP